MPTQHTPIDLLRKAMQAKLVRDASNAELAAEFQKIYFIIGLRPHHFPDDNQSVLIFNYLRTSYPLRTLDELFLAFDMAIKGIFEVNELKVYDQFTIAYMVGILNAYRKYVNNINSTIEYKPPVQQKVIVNQADKQKDIEEYLQRKDLTKRNLIMIPLYIYDNMVELGYIKQSEQRKLQMYKMATDLYEGRLRYDAKDFERNALITLNRFIKQRENDEISDATIQEIKQIYQKLSELDVIQKNNATTKA